MDGNDSEMLGPDRRWYARHAHRFTPAERRMLLYRGDRRTSDFAQWVARGVHLSVDPARWLRETDEPEIAAALDEHQRQPLRARLRFKGERNLDRRAMEIYEALHAPQQGPTCERDPLA